MSRTYYDTPAEIESRIDLFIAKRDKSLKMADWLQCGATWLRGRANLCIGEASIPTVSNLIASAQEAEEEAAKLRSAAEHEDRVTIPKLKAKLAEIQTAPLPGVGETTVARK